MEKKFKSLSIFEFQERFTNDEDCRRYLYNKKWANGFTCEKCGHTRCGKGQREYVVKCNSCNMQYSPTSGTLFHKVKFPLLKAFYIVFYVSTSKKGISSTELSRKLDLRQKTCWLFKRKVMAAMKSSGKHPLDGDIEVDETNIGGQESKTRGRKNIKKKLVVIALERHKETGAPRAYARVIENAGSKQLSTFFENHINTNANITTDKWRGYRPLKKTHKKIRQLESGKKGKNFPVMHRWIMGLKGWLRGVHHHATDLQAYLDEYTYRYNRHFMKEGIFENLLNRMLVHEPVPYKLIKVN